MNEQLKEELIKLLNDVKQHKMAELDVGNYAMMKYYSGKQDAFEEIIKLIGES
jgi:hypothetical protein